MMSRTARNAVVVIAVVVGCAALYWLRSILGPPVLAGFLMIMVDGLAREMRRRVPKIGVRASLGLSLTLVILAFAGSVWIVIDGLAGLATQVPELRARLNAIIHEAAVTLHMRAAPSLDQLVARLDVTKWAGSFALNFGGIAWDALFILIYLGFLLAARRTFGRKMAALFATHSRREEAIRVFDRIRAGVESYVWVTTVVNLLVAALSYGVMAAVGLDNALFWAFVVFVTGYIPIIGGIIALVAPGVIALMQFDTLWQAAVIVAGIEVILFGMGNIVLPRMQARSMNVDPVVVLLSFAFWGALWGVTGAFLSTPLTVVVMAICAEFQGSRWLAILISGDGRPYPVEPPPEAELAPVHKRRRAAVKKIS
jgi:predicted PurR-regulated permease PerM